MDTRSRRFLSLAAPCLAISAVAACTASPDDGARVNGSVDEELRALAPSEIVGDLREDASVDVSYSETPRYRALRVAADAGDTIDVSVHAKSPAGAEPIAWLLAPSYRTLARSTDGHIVEKASAAGEYFVALREANLEDAVFTVTRAGGDAGAPDAGAVDAGPPSVVSESGSAVLPLSVESYGTCYVPAPSQVTAQLTVSGTWPNALTVTSDWGFNGPHTSKVSSYGSFDFLAVGGMGRGNFHTAADGSIAWPLVADITSYAVSRNAGTVNCEDVGGYTARLASPVTVTFAP